ncbi:MAG: hypothetical protein AAB340_02300 [Patescibacteria group bacterium]
MKEPVPSSERSPEKEEILEAPIMDEDIPDAVKEMMDSGYTSDQVKEALKRNYENRKQKNVGEIKKVETISSPDIPVDMDKGSRKIESALMVWGTCKVKEGNQKLLLATSLGAVAVAISVNLESFTVQEYGATDMRAGSDGTTYWGVASIILTGNKDNPFVEISLIGGK